MNDDLPASVQKGHVALQAQVNVVVWPDSRSIKPVFSATLTHSSIGFRLGFMEGFRPVECSQ